MHGSYIGRSCMAAVMTGSGTSAGRALDFNSPAAAARMHAMQAEPSAGRRNARRVHPVHECSRE